jgi:hypothetical protein
VQPTALPRAQIESHTRFERVSWRRLTHAPTRRLTLIVSRAKREEELAQERELFEIEAGSRGERRRGQADRACTSEWDQGVALAQVKGAANNRST